MDRPRILDRLALRDAVTVSTTRPCEARGCRKNTRNGKPFCTNHIERFAYVRKILQELEDKAKEEDNVKKKGRKAVDPKGLTAQEMLLHLALHGGRTIERLAQDMNLEADVVRSYVYRLKAIDLVFFDKTDRGSTTVNPMNGAA